MDISSTSGPLTTIEADWLIVGYTATDSSGELDAPLSDLDEALGGAVSRLVAAGDLTGNTSSSSDNFRSSLLGTPSLSS